MNNTVTILFNDDFIQMASLSRSEKEQKDEREKRITINITMNSETKAANVPANATGVMFRDEVARAFNITVRKEWHPQAFDWVLCLEVAEHIPVELEHQFLWNL
ncbi:unnamed protein product, partial [Symbiodinium microadriaticum]